MPNKKRLPRNVDNRVPRADKDSHHQRPEGKVSKLLSGLCLVAPKSASHDAGSLSIFEFSCSNTVIVNSVGSKLAPMNHYQLPKRTEPPIPFNCLIDYELTVLGIDLKELSPGGTTLDASSGTTQTLIMSHPIHASRYSPRKGYAFTHSESTFCVFSSFHHPEPVLMLQLHMHAIVWYTDLIPSIRKLSWATNFFTQGRFQTRFIYTAWWSVNSALRHFSVPRDLFCAYMLTILTEDKTDLRLVHSYLGLRADFTPLIKLMYENI